MSKAKKTVKTRKMTPARLEQVLELVHWCNDLRQLKRIMKLAAKRIDTVNLMRPVRRPYKRVHVPTSSGYNPYTRGGYAFGGPVV